MSFFKDLGHAIFSPNSSPFDAAGKAYRRGMGQAAAQQKPYSEFGARGIPLYEEWLSGMKDPAEFINSLMGQYESSPYSSYLQDQAMKSAQNAASASGLGMSTPMMRQAQQSAHDISKGDMQDWLGQVLGINTQYGAGLGNQLGIGQGAANTLSNLYGQQALGNANLAFGRSKAGIADALGNVSNFGNFMGGFQQGMQGGGQGGGMNPASMASLAQLLAL